MLLWIKLGISRICSPEHIRRMQNDVVGSSAHLIVHFCTFFRVTIKRQEVADA